MRNIKLTIQYDGSRYKGWQRLSDTDKHGRTVLARRHALS